MCLDYREELRRANAKRLVVFVADLFGVDVFHTAAMAWVAQRCLFFSTIHFGCCSSKQMTNWVSILGFLVGECTEWVSEIFTVEVCK
jgi:hypothetical protein